MTLVATYHDKSGRYIADRHKFGTELFSEERRSSSFNCQLHIFGPLRINQPTSQPSMVNFRALAKECFYVANASLCLVISMCCHNKLIIPSQLRFCGPLVWSPVNAFQNEVRIVITGVVLAPLPFESYLRDTTLGFFSALKRLQSCARWWWVR